MARWYMDPSRPLEFVVDMCVLAILVSLFFRGVFSGNLYPIFSKIWLESWSHGHLFTLLSAKYGVLSQTHKLPFSPNFWQPELPGVREEVVDPARSGHHDTCHLFTTAEPKTISHEIGYDNMMKPPLLEDPPSKGVHQYKFWGFLGQSCPNSSWGDTVTCLYFDEAILIWALVV